MNAEPNFDHNSRDMRTYGSQLGDGDSFVCGRLVDHY